MYSLLEMRVGLADQYMDLAAKAVIGHTHSPKAGQGANASMSDTFNLGISHDFHS